MKRNKEQQYKEIVKICDEKGYTLITTFDEYKGTRTKIKYICPIHGEREIRADCLTLGQSCSKCATIKSLKERYDNNFRERMSALYVKAKRACEEKGYRLLSKVEDITCNTSYVKYECPIHGAYEMRINNLINGRGCPECNIDRFVSDMRLNISEVRKRLNEMGAICLNIEDYINLETENLRFICEFCGDSYITSLIKFMRYAKHNCPNCSKKFGSSGELKIHNYLFQNEINYEKEKCFEKCVGERKLPFDFYLPEYNMCIEYQGQQHYHPVEVFKGESGFKLRQKYDKIKKDFCINNGIKLIEIPYWEYENIEKILNNELLILHKDIV